MKKRDLSILPLSLDIYVTDRCNLRCEYCSAGSLLRGGGSRSLSFAEMARAADLFASYVALDDPSPVRTIAFTGGEPFLEFQEMAKTVGYVRSRYGDGLGLYVFTNGTLLDREKEAFLRGHGVEIVVSLDGAEVVNDRHRRFAGAGRASVFEAVMRRQALLPEEAKRAVHIMATFTSRTIRHMLPSVRFFEGLRPKDIHLGLDLYETWSPGRLESLRAVLSQVRRHCARDPKWPFRAYFKDKLRASDDRAPSNSLCLSPEGRFFPCDELCTAGRAGLLYQVGDLKDGVDFRKLGRVYSSVAAAVSRHDDPNGVLSPIDRYFRAKLSGADPAAALRNSGRVTRIFREELGCFVDVECVLKRLERDKHFGDFAHEPRYRGEGEIPAVSIRFPEEPARARQAVDYCLYSPGSSKTVVLKAADLARVFDAVEGIGLYSVLKAGHLGKRVRVLVEGRARGLGPERLRFLRDHGMLLGAVGGDYAVVRFGRRDAAAIGRMAGGAARVRLELRGSDGLWSDAELDAMASGLDDLAKRGGPGPLDLACAQDEADPRALQAFREGLDRLVKPDRTYSGFLAGVR
ncbi:MAG: radical SAM protein [Elusimicrobiota bacterium]